MRRLPILTMLALLSFGAPARAEGPVVVELYTSQGCSSCPPADALLRELAERDGVLALALHVDYWDYIGWADSFADPAHTRRQRAYARAAGHRTVYTPQMVVGGVDHIVGTRPMELMELIAAHAAAPVPVTLEAWREGGMVHIEAVADSPVPGYVVQLVRYVPAETVRILRGENAGETLTYANIVTDWATIGQWDGAAPLQLSAPLAGEDQAVVIVQTHGMGPIAAALRVE